MLYLAFLFFAVLTIVSAGFVLFSKNVLYSAFSLLLTFLGVAALYVFAGADFLAVAQLVVYVGGILVLLVFGVMFTRREGADGVFTGHHYRFAGALLGLASFGGLVYLLSASWPQLATVNLEVKESTVSQLGIALMATYAVPFELIGILLLIAVVGASFVSARKLADQGKIADRK